MSGEMTPEERKEQDKWQREQSMGCFWAALILLIVAVLVAVPTRDDGERYRHCDMEEGYMGRQIVVCEED